MNTAELKKEILDSIGNRVVKIEIDDQHLTTAIKKAYRWFSVNKGRVVRRLLSVSGATNEYVLPVDVMDVLDVYFHGSADTTAALFNADFVTGFGSFFVTGLALGGTGTYGSGLNDGGADPYPMSGFVQAQQYSEMLGRVTGSELDWEFFDGNLVLHQPLASSGNLIYEAKIVINDISEIRDYSRDQDLVVRWATAEAKSILGRIRGKYDSLPAAGGDKTLDGDRLTDMAEEEKEKLNLEIRETAMPMMFFAG